MMICLIRRSVASLTNFFSLRHHDSDQWPEWLIDSVHNLLVQLQLFTSKSMNNNECLGCVSLMLSMSAFSTKNWTFQYSIGSMVEEVRQKREAENTNDVNQSIKRPKRPNKNTYYIIMAVL